MSFRLRIWAFAVAFLFVAEDFHYLLKIGSPLIVAQQTEDPNSTTSDNSNEEESEAKNETEEDKKEEKREKDENTNEYPNDLLNDYSRLITNKFRDAIYPLSDIAHELESPPPEI